MRQEDLMSYIQIGVGEQRARVLIDQLATADHTLEKYKSICEGCNTTDNNRQIFNSTERMHVGLKIKNVIFVIK